MISLTPTQTRRALRIIAIAAGLFCVLATGLLVRHFGDGRAFHIQDDQKTDELRKQLYDDPDNFELKQEIRDRDLALREKHFRDMQMVQLGSVMLLIAGVILTGSLLGLQRLAGLHPPRPSAKYDDVAHRQSRTMRAAVAMGLLFIIGAGLCAWQSRPIEKPRKTPPPTLNFHWPRFRGVGGNGWAKMNFHLPASGRFREGKEILWRRRVPLPGKNSPVCWGNYIFVASASKARRAVYCYQADSGRRLWVADMPPVENRSAKELELHEDTGQAPSTMATDGKRVYAVFPTGDLMAVDFTGRVVWAKHLGWPANQYGHAASLLCDGETLLVPFDQTQKEHGDKLVFQSELLAFDGATGEKQWEVDRNVPDSWSTPILIEHAGQKQIVTVANPWVIGYDTKGKKLWRLKTMSGDVAPSPVYAAGRIFVTMQDAGLFAVSPTGKLLWKQTKGEWPDITSPLATEKFVLTLTTSGLLRCFSASDGKELWKHDFEKSCYASPTLLAKDRVLIVAADGEMITLRIGENLTLQRKARLEDNCFASPSFGDGYMVIRGKGDLYVIRSSADE